MKNLIFLLGIIILGIAQSTILDCIKIFNVKPDLLLICIVIISLVLESRQAFILSVFAGLFKDSFSPNAFGINTILFAAWSFLIIKLSKQISIEDNFTRLPLIFITAFVHNTAYGLILICLGTSISWGIFFRNISIASLYTTFFLPILFKLSENINYRITRA